MIDDELSTTEAELPAEPVDLRSLLARIRAGDESAARELLICYEAQVRLVVRRRLPKLLRSRFDSLDFLQSVWGDFFQRMRNGAAEFEDPSYLIAFLARAARNKNRNRRYKPPVVPMPRGPEPKLPSFCPGGSG